MGDNTGNNSSRYTQRKAFFERMLTVYGRKPVLEALLDPALTCHALHLADSNRETGPVRDILRAAEQRGIPVHRHNRAELARISHNGRQDQGVAADILCPGFRQLADYLAAPPTASRQRLLALDGITNPQNMGMIIRSAAAGAIDGILCSRRGNAALGPLVIKASAGTLYRAPLLHCDTLPSALADCRKAGFEVCTLRADAPLSLFEHRPRGHCIYVLGNETEGVSEAVQAQADQGLAIPMNNGVESLNVAVTASLIAFGAYFER
ncbi:23S rRNA (guanosine(2251)-2'-O)-methyltransferase RlmB [Kineobactrum sediminis]|uniref:23S rRNA (Guanosine(2251)-2'-O)-methyltransferase RlmB n=1 Tax=Kineobactrum sediminis TaxID=1905677 RepID=A0A2N5Y1F0_9GAMM|nr:RNA methyltransferase [Kineobactrum sediminis]PLW82216.1 23S rRNA (guanosine(2251)-2'-O)-methyltransferase RlmB [Kineobactrum sediminis]